MKRGGVETFFSRGMKNASNGPFPQDGAPEMPKNEGHRVDRYEWMQCRVSIT